jgi:hypothetical protein
VSEERLKITRLIVYAFDAEAESFKERKGNFYKIEKVGTIGTQVFLWVASQITSLYSPLALIP